MPVKDLWTQSPWAVYTAKVTITDNFNPTGASLSYLNGGMPVNLCEVQDHEFTRDPDDGTKYTFKLQVSSGTYSDVTLKVSAHRDASSANGGTLAADKDDKATGLTVTKS